MLNFSPQLPDTLSREFWMFNFAPRLRGALTRGFRILNYLKLEA